MANLKPKKAGILQKMKTRIINVASDAMSYPARRKSQRIQRQADFDVATLKGDRALGGKMPYPDDESNPDFRTHINAIHVRDRLKRNSNY